MVKNQRTKRNCPTCDELFMGRNYPNRIQKYCNKLCWEKRNPPTILICYCGRKKETYQREQKYCSNECRNKDYKKRKGKNVSAWKGGRTHKNKLLRTSADFREWRRKVFERDNYACQNCGIRSKKGERVYIHPHHIKYLSTHPELAFDVENGLTLCVDCHFERHKAERVEHGE